MQLLSMEQNILNKTYVCVCVMLLFIMIVYIYNVLINALSDHMIPINLKHNIPCNTCRAQI